VSIQLPAIEVGPDGPLAQGSSPELLSALLSELDEMLLANKVPVADLLSPGVSEEYVLSQMGSVGLTPPAELLVWFGWHNGATRAEGRPSIAGVALPAFVPGSVRSSGAHYRLHLGVPETSTNVVGELDPDLEALYVGMGGGVGWFPLAADGNGMLIECNISAGTAPKLHSYDLEFDSPDARHLLRAVSLCTIATWWLEEISSGAWAWDADRKAWDENIELTSATRRQASFGF
jgi:hypothetical protein